MVSAKIKIFLLIGLLVEVSTSFSFAFRPFRTEDAGTSPRGGFGLELGNEFTNNDDGKENTNTISLIYGPLDWIETEIDFAIITLRPDSGQDEFGLGDTVILSKFKIFGENGIISKNELLPEVVLEPSISIPTGDEDEGLGSGKIEPGLLLVLEKVFFEKLAARANFGYFASNDPSFDENFGDRFFYGFQIDFPLFIERLRLGSELTGEFGSAEESPLFTLTGLVFEITENIVLDGGVEFGLNDSGNAVTAIVGVSFGFNIFQEEAQENK